MSNKLRVWVAVAFMSILGMLSVSAQAATKTWNNPAGGRWDGAANWTPVGAPLNGDDVVITLPGTYNVTYVPVVLNTSFASITLGGASGTQTLTNSAFVMTLAGASVVNANGVLAESNGTLNGSGNLSVDGIFNWSGGFVSGSGSLTINAPGTLNLSGSNKYLSRNLINNGTINWNSGTGSLGLTPSTTLTNNNAFNIGTNAPISRSGIGANASFVNAGTLTKTNGTTSMVNIDFANSGTVNINSGTLDTNSGGTYAQSAGSTNLLGGNLSISGNTIQINGGSVTGNGTITGALNNAAGALTPGAAINTAGAITVTGKYTQGASASLNVDLGGTTPGTLFDQLSVGGTATIAGTLNVNSISAFDPAPGDTFLIVNAATRTGTFSPVNRSGFSPGKSLEAVYNPTNVTLAASDLTATITTPVDGSSVNAPAKVRGNITRNPVGGSKIASATLVIKEVETGNYWNGSSWQAGATSFSIVTDAGTNTFGANNGPGTADVTSGNHYEITATAVDASGNSATSATVTVTSDTARPTITIDNGPANGSTVTVVNTPLIGTASDADSGLKEVGLSLYRQSDAMYWNGSTWQSAFIQLKDSVTPATWSIGPMPSPGANPSTDLTDGVYTLVAAAYDNAGNNKGETRSFTVKSTPVPPDNVRPTITIDNAPANGSVVAAINTPITGTASDADSGLKEVGLLLYRQSDGMYWNGSTWQAGFIQLKDAVTPATWSIGPMPSPGANPSTDLTDGVYALVAAAYDNAGNNKGVTRSFTVDSSAPSDVSITKIGAVSNPVDNDVVATLMPVQGTATDTGSGIARVELMLQRNSDSFYWNGSTWQAGSFILSTGLSTPSSGVYPWARNGGMPNSGSSLSNGFYTLTATAFDRNGQSTAKVITVEVSVP